jgi:hypothetical protein
VFFPFYMQGVNGSMVLKPLAGITHRILAYGYGLRHRGLPLIKDSVRRYGQDKMDGKS